MSTSKQQRRADKKRRAAQARHAHRADAPGADTADALRNVSVDQLIAASLDVFGDKSFTQAKLLELAAALNGQGLNPTRAREVGAAIDRLLVRCVDSMFEHGWQPADVAHFVKRTGTQRSQRLVVAVIAGHARRHDAVDRAPHQWLDQLDDLGVVDAERKAVIGGRADAFSTWARTERVHEDEATMVGLQVLAHAIRAQRLSRLIDQPSEWGATNRGAFAKLPATVGEIDAKALKLIRNLLAKAEATTFEAEAATFSAKAQELMTRHSIDAAVIASAARGSGHDFGVESRRVHIDNPYADEKAVLLAVIADVNGVRSVWSPRVGFSTVVGIPVDLHLTDLLFTSLLVQATKASAETTGADRRLSTPSFRRAFLTAFANRIGERLEAAKAKVGQEASAEYGTELVHILADRAAAVDTAFAEAFPETVQMASRRLDARGYHAGRAAADRAHIGAGDAIARR
ncbi:MAG: uncharacterized protein JWL72_1762 [Ilumatobacteraceae bacterium]|nr:uncharacterized protein [Ilumatobacteraceae bacterium]